MKLIIRQDDFDFRLPPEKYIENHKKFIEAGLTETAVLQLCQNGNLAEFHPDIIEYLKTAPNWDIQLHGWSHDNYSEMKFQFVLRDISAAMYWVEGLLGKKPTIWFPPWNQTSVEMKEVAKILELEINNESNDIEKFIREVKDGSFKGGSVYYHLWHHHDFELIDEMIECAKQYVNNG